jgi:hypothetical protein
LTAPQKFGIIIWSSCRAEDGDVADHHALEGEILPLNPLHVQLSHMMKHVYSQALTSQAKVSQVQI